MASYRGTSGGSMTVATTTTSPKSQCGSGGDAQNGAAATALNSTTSPKGGQCLCSPTTHQGSFRCKFHRSNSTAYFKRSKSMPMNQNNSPKSVESS